MDVDKGHWLFHILFPNHMRFVLYREQIQMYSKYHLLLIYYNFFFFFFLLTPPAPPFVLFFPVNHPVAERADCMQSSPSSGLTASSSSWIRWRQVFELVINLQYLCTLQVWLFFHPLPSGNRKTSLSVLSPEAGTCILISRGGVKLAFYSSEL